ncbi:MAG: hypothetical protein H5U26_14340 [Immundisolibacter sp.]|uniref:hypothetical protein n=1 Tax=Immundisolibacter sp. TaxID=1934948 RepID=UPI00199D1A5C|nr:hypothetical protein [Immundisolibacter sp.]MBC7163266.1 hypothetical protein [Immundisolibacter sp.]
MLPTTILVDDAPRCVVRPNDAKALSRFIRSGRPFLLGKKPDGTISHRPAEAGELAKWCDALALHEACGGTEDEYFGVPL